MSFLSRIIGFIVLVTFLTTSIVPVAYAASLTLPPAGQLLATSPAFTPVVLKGMVIHPEDPLKFDFLMDTGTDKVSGDDLRQEADKSIKYFLASLTTPDDDMWVNLSPVEKDRVIPDAFGKTVMGRDVLAQDYVLKQLASSLLYPENGTGKQFWARMYAEAAQKFGSTDIKMDDFNRVWIVPSQASVWENEGKVVILKSHLKVMLESDYKAMSGSTVIPRPQAEGSQNVLREVLIPALEKEVNEGANFARLRQVYAAMILSSWYKIRLKEGLLGKAYADKNKVAGIEFGDGVNKDDIYGKYMEAVKKGAFNYIREEQDPLSGDVVPRKYFSGGFTGKILPSILLAGMIFAGSLAGLPTEARAQVADSGKPAGEMIRVVAGVQDVGTDASMESEKTRREIEYYRNKGFVIEEILNAGVNSSPGFGPYWYYVRFVNGNRTTVYGGLNVRVGQVVKVEAAVGEVFANSAQSVDASMASIIPTVLHVANWHQSLSLGEQVVLWSGVGVVAGLVGYAVYKRKYIKLAALKVMGNVEGVVKMLNDPDWGLRKAAMDALDKKVTDPQQKMHIVEQFYRDAKYYWDVRAWAYSNYVMLKASEVMSWQSEDRIEKELTIDVSEIRLAAMRALDNKLTDAARGLAVYEQALGNKYPEVKAWALRRLEAIGSEQALDLVASQLGSSFAELDIRTVTLARSLLQGKSLSALTTRLVVEYDARQVLLEAHVKELVERRSQAEVRKDYHLFNAINAELRAISNDSMAQYEYVYHQGSEEKGSYDEHGMWRPFEFGHETIFVEDYWAMERISVTQGPDASQSKDRQVGGINLDSRKLDLQIKRDGKGVPLPVDQQDWANINIQGFIPVIYKIEPVNMSALLELSGA